MALWVTPLSLPEAVRNALDFDPTISQSQASLAASEAGVNIARAQRGLNIGLQAQIGVSETDFTIGSVSQNPRSVGIQAELPLYQFGALSAGIDAAKSSRQVAKARQQGTREKITLDVVEAFAQTWLAEHTHEVARQQVESFEIKLRETKARFEQGLATRTDVALTEARLASSQAQHAATQAQYISAKQRLARLTGISDPEPANPFAAPLILPDSAEALLALALKRNPDLHAAKAVDRAADYQVKQSVGSFGPKISLKARASSAEESYFFLNEQINDSAAFLTLEMPLFTSGLRGATIDKARANKARTSATTRDAELQLREAVYGIWGNMEAQSLSLEAAKRAEQAAKLGAEGAQKEYQAGVRTLLDALDAENAYRDAQIARFRAEASLYVTKAQLISLTKNLEQSLLSAPQ